MKRTDRRTPRQIAHQRYTHLLRLPDAELLEQHLRLHDPFVTRLPHGPCSYAVITQAGTVRGCLWRGEWGVQIPDLGVRRRCVTHAADAIRARLRLQKRRLERGMIPDDTGR